MNNWHRKIYVLEGDSNDVDYRKVYKDQALNHFWLEPGVYTGPPIDVLFIHVEPNSLCYRAEFVGGDMADPWRGCEFFPGGVEDLTFDAEGKPQPTRNTQRLQALTMINGQKSVISLYLHPQSGKLLVNVAIIEGPGGGGGWGGGHTFVGRPPNP